MASPTTVPRAMAEATRMASAVRLRPEMMSPAMISRMALVSATPGTSTGEYDSKNDHDHAEGFVRDPRHKGKLGGFPVSAAERKEIVCLHARIIVSARGIQKPTDDPEKALIAPERERNGEDHEKRRRNAAGRAQSILFFPDGKEILRRKHGTIDKRLPLCHNSKAVDRSGGNAASLEKFGKAQKEKQR